MCGFAGLFTSRDLRGDALRDAVVRMRDTLVHRGPDDAGYWADDDAGVALGFRRLAILDLTPAGHQPMASPSGRFTLVFNGEVFNHGDIRRELEGKGYRFRGHSDTEVICAAFEEWGVEAATSRFIGMFAIAAWDARERTLSLVRDRLGIKPLFVYAEPGFVSFGSELKALVAGPWFDRSLDVGAVASFLRGLYVPGPHSVWQRVRKVTPGSVLTLRSASAPIPADVPYWSLDDVARNGLSSPFTGDDEALVDEVDALLRDAVRRRMEADVPLGALLSGGIDSSLVVALLQEASSRPVKTFSVGMDAREHDEATHAGAVAAHLGTDHTLVRLDGNRALDFVPRLAEVFDEPHADASSLPELVICEVARQQVTVALSGDGADEFWAGYSRYQLEASGLGRLMSTPGPVRRGLAGAIGTLSPDAWDAVYRGVEPALPKRLRQRLPGDKLHKVRGMLRTRDVAEAYAMLASAWHDPQQVVRGAGVSPGPIEQAIRAPWPPTMLDRILLADQKWYLTDDQLAKADRASMAVSLELRVPLVDHRLVELSWRLPTSAKLRGTTTKWALRQVLYRRVPRELLERPKMGFTLPLAAWLQGPLRPWAEELLRPDALAKDGLLDPVPIRRDWEAVLAGRDQRALRTWAVLMLQAWRTRWMA